MNKHEYTVERPFWYDGKMVNEVGFCEDFLQKNPMVCVSGSFFTKDGRVADEEGIRKQIYEMLRPISTAVSQNGHPAFWKHSAWKPMHRTCRYTKTGSMWPTARCFSAVNSPSKKTSAATACRSNMIPMLRSL